MSDDKPEFVFVSRYGGPDAVLPDPETMCQGQCEGMGVVPIHADDIAEPFHTLWLAAEEKAPAEDGWHFVQCPECGGSGKRLAA